MLCAQCRERRLRVFASVFGRNWLCSRSIPYPIDGGCQSCLLQQLLFRRLHNRVTHLLYGHLGAVD